MQVEGPAMMLSASRAAPDAMRIAQPISSVFKGRRQAQPPAPKEPEPYTEQREFLDKVTTAIRQSPKTTLGFLNRAHVCAQLAARVYDSKDLTADQQRVGPLDIPLPSLPEPKSAKGPANDITQVPAIPKVAEANFVDSQCSQGGGIRGFKDFLGFYRQHGSEGAAMSDFIQYGIYHVTDLGYVVAFRGSQHWEDWMANFQAGSTHMNIQPDITVHKGIYTRAADACDDILKSINQHAGQQGFLSSDGHALQEIPLLLTGQ